MNGYEFDITAKLANGIPASLSNYIDRSSDNGIYDLYDIIEKADGNADTAARLLTTNRNTYGKYEVFKVCKDGFILRVTDYCGNKSFMTIKNDTPKMEDTRTYHVGNGEITLTAEDANELRRILQFEYIEGCIENIIENDPDYFVFNSEHNRSRFVSKVAERYDDLVDVYGCHGECLDEDVYHVARCVGCTDADEAEDSNEFRGFWKE